MDALRIWAMMRIGFRGHILNWFWRDRNVRRTVRRDVVSQEVPRYFKRYLPAAAAIVETPAIHNDKNEKIFMFWGFKPIPPLVETCMRHARQHLSQDVVLLNEKTLYDYIDLPDIIMDKQKNGQIEIAHFLDICRVELLHNHGGFWLDSTGFVTAKIPKFITEQDFFVFMAGKKYGSPYSFMQNCFIRSRKGAYLLEAWRAMIHAFWMHEPREFDYFMHQLMFKAVVQNDQRAKEYFARMPHVDQDPTHILWADYRNEKFDQKVFDKITTGAFFHKTTYRDTINPIPGSFADVIRNM